MVPSLRRRLESFARSKLAKFRPWCARDGRSPQAEFLRGAGTHHVRVFRGGNRSGKTFILGVDAALRLQGWHPAAKRGGPVHGWLVGTDWDAGVGGILWPAVKQWLEPDQVKGITYQRRGDPEIPLAVSFKNGSLLEFKSADSDLKKFAGAKLHFAGLDEEVERGLANEVRMRLVDLGGDLALTLTPIQRRMWIRDLEREAGTLLVRASSRDNPHLDQVALADALAGMGARERRVRELGDLVALEGLAYPEFDRAVHVLRPRGAELIDGAGVARFPWPLPTDWPRVAAMDFGFTNPAAVPVPARAPGGELVVDRLYYAAGVKITTWARALKEALPPIRDYDWRGNHDGRGRLARAITCDHDAGERAELESAGLGTVAAKKDVDVGIAAVTRRLVAKRLFFVVHGDDRAPLHPVLGRCDAHMLAWEFEGYRYREPEEGKPSVRDQPIKKDDHALDALRYLVMAEDQGFALPKFAAPKRSDHFLDAASLPPPKGW